MRTNSCEKCPIGCTKRPPSGEPTREAILRHDARNLVASILMRAELLIDAADGRQPPEREDACAILEAGRALLILLDDKRSGEHVCSVIETLTGLLRDLLGDRVRLDVVVDYSCRVPLSSDELASVLINLVLNARDAIDRDGRVLVHATCVTATDDIARRLEIASGPYMCLEVADDGAGMDAATAARVFDPFFTTKGTRGSGLGLYGVKRRVDRAGGTVVCDSEPGKGTHVRVYLPMLP